MIGFLSVVTLVSAAAHGHDSLMKTAPDVAARVAQESQENIQIHDGFLADEKKDIVKEKQVKANKDLSALQVKKTAPDVAEKVAQESRENIQIHDGFLAEEKKDIAKEKQVKANKDLSALQTTKKTAPDVAEKVAQEAKENIQIHDGF